MKGALVRIGEEIGGGYCRSGRYVKDDVPKWSRCGDCQARVLPGSPEMHDGDCNVRAALVSFGLGR